MKSRHTAWLLTVLLSIAGCFGVPAARIAIPRAGYTVAWVEKSVDATKPGRLEIAESGQTVPSPPAQPAPLSPNDVAPPSALLDGALFQRPPPPQFSRP